MSANTLSCDARPAAEPASLEDETFALQTLLAARPARSDTMPAIVVGELLGVGNAGASAYVSWPGQGGQVALPARTIAILQSSDVGRAVVLTFDAGDPRQPIILGVLRDVSANALEAMPGQVELSADGTRLTVCARDRLELRCGIASLTLTKAGRIVIDGQTIVSRSAGVNRIVGGSVQIN